MPIPILLVATAIGAGTLGYYVGRTRASSTICVVSNSCGENENEDQEHQQHECEEQEQETSASMAPAAPESCIPMFLARQQKTATTETAPEYSIPAFLARQAFGSASRPRFV